jgi:exodeoxyribonuclease VII small subunit
MPKRKIPELSFEAALKRLESLIESMEDGEIPLAELVEKFEEGAKLLKSCQANLKQAELTIEKLNFDTDTLEAHEPEEKEDA